MIRFGAILVCLWLITAFSRANDGWMVYSGAAYQFGRSNPNIQMVSEDLRISLVNGGADVEVHYLFKNHGPQTRVIVGFPEERANVEGRGIWNFRSWVDGKQVSIKRKSISANFDLREYKVVWIKEVSFQRHGSRRIVVKYKTSMSGDTSGNYNLYYTLSTANSWKMPIVNFKATVDWKGMNVQSKPFFELPGALNSWKVTGWRQRTATLRNFVPRLGLNLKMRFGFWNFRFNGKRVTMPDSGEDYIFGSGRDPMIRLSNCRRVLGELGQYAHDDGRWDSTLLKYFGGPFEVTARHIVMADKSVRPLARKAEMRKFRWETENVPYVYIRDVVRALGGTFRYNRREERVDITFVSKRKR